MAIIASKSWKYGGFRRIVEYINSDKGRMDKDTSFPAIYHGINGSTLEDAIKALRECSEKRSHKRKDAVTVYHEIISFHKDDRPTIAELEDLAQKWISLRANGQDAVCFARAHLHTKALHIHFAFGGTDLHGRALRLTNEEFLKIRREHEAYQVQKYNLTRSVVYLDKERFRILGKEESEKKTRAQRDFSRKKRLQESGKSEKSHKEHCHDVVLESLQSSQSFDGFEKAIQSKGLGLYHKGSRLEGVLDSKGRKYRFRSLGLDVAILRSIEQARGNQETYQRRVASLSALRPRGRENEREK